MKKLIYLLLLPLALAVAACGGKNGSSNKESVLARQDSVDAHGLQRASGDKGIEVYVNDKLIGNIDSKGTTKLKIGYVSEDELLTVKFHADNAEYTLYSISLDKGQAET